MSSNEINPLRRLVLGGLSIGVAVAALAGTARAQSAAPAAPPPPPP